MGERYSSVSDALRPPDELHRSFRAVRESGEGLTGLRRFDEGFEAVSLGKRILRTETAGMFVLSVLGFLLDDRSR